MKTRSYFLLCCCIFLFAAPSFCQSDPVETGSQADEIYYVLAPRGLNLRNSASVNSGKIATVPYGAEVSLLEKAGNADMMIDNLPGGMAKVKYGDQIGYMFDGYLCRMPAPNEQDQRDMRAYVDRARSLGRLVYYEKCERDYDGYYQTQENITPFIVDWAEAYLLAQRLFDMPEKLLFPKASAEKDDQQENPDKQSHVWEDSLQVKRNDAGEIVEIVYFYRQEGGGRAISITRDPEQESLLLSQVLIAD